MTNTIALGRLDDYLTSENLARELGVDRPRISRLWRAGRIQRPLRIGHTLVWPVADLPTIRAAATRRTEKTK